MSRYIGKRVSYPCGQCGEQITLSRKTKDDSANSGEVFCSEQCFEQFRLAHVIRSVCIHENAYQLQHSKKYCTDCNKDIKKQTDA